MQLIIIEHKTMGTAKVFTEKVGHSTKIEL